MISRLYCFLDKKYEKKSFRIWFRCIKSILNILMPLYTMISKRNKLDSSSEYIVSFTSFPARIKRVYLVAECLVRQITMPSDILLYLSKTQFSGLNALPWRLRRLEKLGLISIIFVDGDIRSHKKYYYCQKDYYNKSMIVVDDDMFYPEDLIYGLDLTKKNVGEAICCNRAYQIKMINGDILPYKTWRCDVTIYDTMKNDLLPIGCGGVLYPKNSFVVNDLLNIDKAMKLCPNADDIWLKVQSIRHNTPVIRSSYYKHSIFCDILFCHNMTLCDSNVGKDQNDIQIHNVITEYPDTIERITS